MWKDGGRAAASTLPAANDGPDEAGHDTAHAFPQDPGDCFPPERPTHHAQIEGKCFPPDVGPLSHGPELGAPSDPYWVEATQKNADG